MRFIGQPVSVSCCSYRRNCRLDHGDQQLTALRATARSPWWRSGRRGWSSSIAGVNVRRPAPSFFGKSFPCRDKSLARCPASPRPLPAQSSVDCADGLQARPMMSREKLHRPDCRHTAIDAQRFGASPLCQSHASPEADHGSGADTFQGRPAPFQTGPVARVRP